MKSRRRTALAACLLSVGVLHGCAANVAGPEQSVDNPAVRERVNLTERLTE
jgi:hypothetical protein